MKAAIAFPILVVVGVGGFVIWASGESSVLFRTPTPLPAAVVDNGPSPEDMRQAKAQFDRDRDALRKAKPKTEAQVLQALGRRADNCTLAGGNNYCMWYYATKPPEQGRDVLQVVFDGKGGVFLMDN